MFVALAQSRQFPILDSHPLQQCSKASNSAGTEAAKTKRTEAEIQEAQKAVSELFKELGK